jgi:hypothetical protein
MWTAVLAVASAIVLLSNAAKAIAQAWKAAKAPNAAQDARLDAQDARMAAMEKRLEKAERKLENDKAEFTTVNDGLRASYQVQLALLDHALNGNNIEQMQTAKKALQKHIINR